MSEKMRQIKYLARVGERTRASAALVFEQAGLFQFE
jgi:hypothetical protein